MSARIPGEALVIITASGVSLRNVTLQNLLVMDMAGTVLENPAGLRPSKETRLHLGIYRAREDAGAVLHLHPNYAIAISNQRRTIPLVTASAEGKLRQGPVVSAAAGGSELLAKALVEAVEAAPQANVFLMERHGIAVFGPTLCLAFDDAELAEDTAQIAFLTEVQQLGQRTYLG